ncbi:MAG TPA: BlaI/MecI/CopY family transcriptional regulator [Verrucomicrobiae bacterium]|nr:BlaI/MecI/CopY family transcriptional regulator [Verrucomicrobiae bacterium]
MSFKAKAQKNRNRTPRISEAEWIVMKVVWRLHTATAKQVVEALAGDADWKPKTIHTLLSRLVQKGVLATEKPAREYLFRPRVSEEECRVAASRSFIARVFDGQVAPFLACFLADQKLSRKEIEEIRSILNDK